MDMTFSFGLDVNTGDHNCRLEGGGSLADGREIEITSRVMVEGFPTVHQNRKLKMMLKRRNNKASISANLTRVLTDMVLEATNNPGGRITEEGRQNIREWVENVVY